jgi:WD40 repeat protein
MGPDMQFAYDAFVSYSRQADGEFALALVGAIRSYFGLGRGERLHVFRDTESLTAASGLTSELDRNLANSRYLILLASPEAAMSSYVQAEVAYWLANRGLGELVLVVTDGTIEPDRSGNGVDDAASTAIPPLLAQAYTEPPLYVDCRALRVGGAEWTLWHPAFADKVAELVATLSGQTKDQVRGQRLDALRRESELLATRLLDKPPEDPELYLLLAIEAVAGSAPSARAVLALNDAIWSSRLRGCYTGHEGPVTACRFLADGQRFVTASLDSTVRLWSAPTGEVLAVYEHHAPVQDVSVSPDSAFLATALEDGSAHVWNVDGVKHLAELIGHVGPVRTVAFSPDSRYVVTASEDRTARLWDVDGGRLLRTLRKRNREPRSATFSPVDSSVVVTGAWRFWLLVWDTRRARIKRRLRGTDGEAVDVSPDGFRVVAPFDDRILVWDLRRRGRRPLLDLKGHSANVGSVAFSVDGEAIVSAAGKTVFVWRSDGTDEPLRVSVPTGVIDARLSPDGTFLLTACDDSTARLWELRPRQESATIGPVKFQGVAAVSRDGMILTYAMDHPFALWDVDGRQVGRLGTDIAFFRRAVFSPDATVVACAGADSTVSLWDTRDASLVASWPVGHGDIPSLAFTPDGAWLLIAGEDGTVGTWAVGEGSRTGLVEALPGKVETVLCSPRGDRFATVHQASAGESFASGVGLFDANSGIVRILDEHRDAVTAVGFSPDGAQLATASWDGRLRTYDSSSGGLLWSVDQEVRVEDLAYSPDGSVLATTNQYSTDVWLWERATGDLVLRLTHGEWVGNPRFSSDGTELLVLSHGTAYLWDLQEAELVNVLYGHEGWLRTGEFVAGDRRIVTAADDGTVRIWDNPTLDELVALARTRTFRDLAAEERREYGLRDPQEPHGPATQTAATHDARVAVTRAAFPLRRPRGSP